MYEQNESLFSDFLNDHPKLPPMHFEPDDNEFMIENNVQSRFKKKLKINTQNIASAELAPMTVPPADLNRKAPGFVQTPQFVDLLNERNEMLSVDLKPRLEGGFFIYDQIWTCYRRNFFRCLSTFNLYNQMTQQQTDPNEMIYVKMPNEKQMKPVQSFKIQIYAKSNHLSEHRIDLVMHTSKKSSCMPNMKTISPGGSPQDHIPKTPLTPTAHVMEQSGGQVCAYDRLQFKTATANNGKRKAIQQYYRIVVELYAQTEPLHTMPAEQVLICQAESENVVVRGRSPGHYADLEKIRTRKTKQVKSAFEMSPYFQEPSSAMSSPFIPSLNGQPWTAQVTTSPVEMLPYVFMPMTGDWQGNLMKSSGSGGSEKEEFNQPPPFY